MNSDFFNLCHGKYKEIVWNKVKFATYPSVWPATPLDMAFNNLQ